MDRRIVAGMEDANPWVRYDAAWAAGELRGDDQAYAAALTRMIEQAEREAEIDEDGAAWKHRPLAFPCPPRFI